MQATTRLLRYYAASGGHKDMDITTPEYSVTSTIVNPHRIQTGTLKLTNDKDSLISYITVAPTDQPSGDTQKIYNTDFAAIENGASEFSKGESFEISLPVGWYKISVTMDKNVYSGTFYIKTGSTQYHFDADPSNWSVAP